MKGEEKAGNGGHNGAKKSLREEGVAEVKRREEKGKGEEYGREIEREMKRARVVCA